MDDKQQLSKPTKPFMKLSDWVTNQHDTYYYSHTTSILYHDQSVMNAVEKELDNIGFRKFSLIGEGNYALAFHSTENQIVRVAVRSEYEKGCPPAHPAILQPIYKKTMICGEGEDKYEVFIEVLPQVRTVGVSEQDRKDVKDALQKSGYSIIDINESGA